MSVDEAIGSVGVGMLLLAFVLNVFGFLQTASRAYQGLNAVGAGIACYASYRIGFIPFVILEATWATIATVALVRRKAWG